MQTSNDSTGSNKPTLSPASSPSQAASQGTGALGSSSSTVLNTPAKSLSTPFPASQDQASDAVQKAGTAVKSAVDQAGQESDDLMKRLVSGAHAAIDKLADAATPTIDRLKGTFSNPSDKLSKLADQAGEKKDAWVSDVRDIVRENPLAAIATALAVGAIYIKLTSNPRRTPADRDDC